jgi:hypothetical protein
MTVKGKQDLSQWKSTAVPELIDSIVAAEHQLYDAFFERKSPTAQIRILPRIFGWNDDYDGKWFPCENDRVTKITMESYRFRNKTLDPVDTYSYPYPVLTDTQPLSEQLAVIHPDGSEVPVFQLSKVGFNEGVTEAVFMVRVFALGHKNNEVMGRQFFICYFANKQNDQWVMSFKTGPEDFPRVFSPGHTHEWEGFNRANSGARGKPLGERFVYMRRNKPG